MSGVFAKLSLAAWLERFRLPLVNQLITPQGI
jgi:hypothetical protein